MVTISKQPYFHIAEDLTQFLCEKTQSTSTSFFRTLVDYNLCKMASVMRITIKTHDRGVIPVNMYAMALAPSGTGKGHSTNILEESVMNGFRERYLEDVLPEVTETRLTKLATQRAQKKATDPDDELRFIRAEFERTGAFVFNFDSATTAAVKQMRHKLLMCGAGAVSMEIDEIGSNLLGNQEVLTTFLELFDVGKIKPKLTKNTNENIRGEEIEGKTPTNLLLFGTPVKLLDGGRTEDEYISMLQTGYARRCFFAYSSLTQKREGMSPEEVYADATNKVSAIGMHKLSAQFERMADITHFGIELVMDKDVALASIKYKLDCEALANSLSDHQETLKAEISHRYFKAIKLAGAYAFSDGKYEIESYHLNAAIQRAEDSGKDFAKILTRERNYVKLAKYIATIDHEITGVDLLEDLPFYRGSVNQKNDLMALAIAWGYRNNVIIKKSFNDGIEFFKGETLEVTDLSKMLLSHSSDFAEKYKPELAPFDKLNRLLGKPAYNWCNHHFVGNYRSDEKVIQGFNLVILDIDATATIEEAQTFLKDYRYHIYTTKRHTDKEHRFRIVLPLSHNLFLNKTEFKQFMDNIRDWLPIEVDNGGFQQSKKWFTHNGQIHSNLVGKSLNALLFIPKTSKSDQLKTQLSNLSNLNNLERWFIHNTGDGNRNQQLIKYALMLVDASKSYDEVESAVKQLNEKLANSLTESELISTILSTTAKAILKREGK